MNQQAALVAVILLLGVGFLVGYALRGHSRQRPSAADARSELGLGPRPDGWGDRINRNAAAIDESLKAASSQQASLPSREHWSSCAVNNAPALEPGPCDCGGYDHTALYDEERAIRLFHALRIGIVKPRKGVVDATWSDLTEEQRDRYRAGVRAVMS